MSKPKVLTREHAEVMAILYGMLYRATPEQRPYMSWYFEYKFGIYIELYPPLDEPEEVVPFESKPSKANKPHARNKIPR